MPVSSGKSSHRYSFDSILTPGTKVLIKDRKWYDSMPKEDNGRISQYDLDCVQPFTAKMSILCGMVLVVTNVLHSGYGTPVYKLKTPEAYSGLPYNFTPAMFDSVVE